MRWSEDLNVCDEKIFFFLIYIAIASCISGRRCRRYSRIRFGVRWIIRNWVAEPSNSLTYIRRNVKLPNDISSSAPSFRSVPFKPPHTLVQKSNNKLEEKRCTGGIYASVDSARRKKLVPLRRFTVYFVLRFRWYQCL